MAKNEGERRLAAILSADVAGYAKLMGDDERATVLTLTDYREVFADYIARHKGRLVDSPGDNVLAEFASPVEAVDAAIDIQHELGRRNRQLAEHRQMHFRIGLNLGDVIAKDDGTIYGDGVNVAARLENLAEPGGICLSGSAHEQVRDKTDFDFEDIGEHEVKNIARAVRAYRVRNDGAPSAAPRPGQTQRNALIAAAAAIVLIIAGVAVWQWTKPTLAPAPDVAASSEDPVLARPTGPSIAVLPFANLSGDPEQEYFSDGLTEQIITALTRFNGLRVASRNSAFQFKGQAVDVREIGRNLNVNFVLEGSIRKASNVIRVTAQLLDATTDSHLWAETYERELTASNVFALQDEITQMVVAKIGQAHGVIPRSMSSAEGKQETDSLFAYDCVLRAAQYLRTFAPEDHHRALTCLQRAVKIAPDYSDAWAWLAFVHEATYQWGYAGVEEPLAAALSAARRAVELDPDSARAHEALATAHYYLHDLERFYDEAERAVALNPNDPSVLADMGNYMAYTGRWERGVALTEKAMELDPVHPGWYFMAPAKKHYWERDYAAALKDFENVDMAWFWMNQLQFAYTLGHMPGREREAQAAVAKLMELYPGFTIETFYEEYRKYNFTQPYMDLAAEGLRKAGLPEGEPATQ